MRYTIKLSPVVRMALLTSVGRTRRAIYLKNYTLTKSGGKVSSKIINGLPVAIFPFDNYMNAFTKALSVGYVGGHMWEPMRLACLELVESFGDRNLGQEVDDATKLKNALLYLLTAIQLTKQRNAITKNCVPLSGDKSFATPLTDSLAAIMSASFTSSMSIAPAPGASVPVVDPKAKGKGPAGAAAVGTASSAVPTGRDALFLLSSVVSESNNLLPDGFEFDLTADLHYTIKKSFSAYESQCSLPGIVDVNTKVAVEYNSVSTLLVPTIASSDSSGGEDHGLFPSVILYVVLGGEPPKNSTPAAVGGKGAPVAAQTTTDDPSSNPILTKINISRPNILLFELQILHARAVLADSVVRKSV